MTALTAIVDAKSKLSYSKGSGPVTLVNVNVCPSTVNDLLSPRPKPLIGLLSTLYSVVPSGQPGLAAPAPVWRRSPVLPTRPIDKIPSPTAIRARISPVLRLPNDTPGLPACRVGPTRLPR